MRYFLHPQVPRRVYEAAPNTKFIVVVRNPVFRTLSHWKLEYYLMQKRDPRSSFEQVVEEQLLLRKDAHLANGGTKYGVAHPAPPSLVRMLSQLFVLLPCFV